MDVILVGSDRPGAGKTSVSLALATLARRSGHSANVYKPFSVSEDDADSGAIAQLSNESLEGWPRSVGSDGPSASDLSALATELSSGDDGPSLNILELPSELGAAGAAGVAETLDARTLLVTQGRRGLRASDVLEWKESLGERLTGVLVNGITDHPDRGQRGEWLTFEEGNDPWERSKHAMCNMWHEWDGMQETVAPPSDRSLLFSLPPRMEQTAAAHRKRR